MTVVTRNDAEVLGLVNASLQYVMPEIDRKAYPEKRFTDRFVPLNPLQAPGVQDLVRQRVSYAGAWELSADYATNIPMVDAYFSTVTYIAKYWRAGIRYSQQELDRLAMANRNNSFNVDITREKLMALEESYAQLRNRLFALGEASIGTFGLLNHPDVPRLTSADRLGFGLSPEANLALLNEGERSVAIRTNAVETVDTLILPIDTYYELNQQRFTNSTDMTVLQHFLNTSPTITNIDWAPENTGAGTGGTDVALFYRRDQSRVEGLTPKNYTLGEPQMVDDQVKMFAHAQISGVHYRRPFSAVLLEFPGAA